MSNPFAEQPQGRPSLFQAAGGGNSLGGGVSSNPFLDQPTTTIGPSLDAPSLPPANLTQTTKFNPRQATFKSMDEMALGRASMILDQVRARRLSWQDAKSTLDTLSAEDKKTLAKFRPTMNEDEKRALGMSKGGGGLLNKLWNAGTDIAEELVLPGSHLIAHGLPDNPISKIVGNFVGDVESTVRTTPAGIYKAGSALASDVGSTFTESPLKSSSILASLTGNTPKQSAFEKEIVKPVVHSYGQTYGPLFHGDPMLTAGRLAQHPLQPVMDALAVASMGVGAAGRIAAVNRALDATKVVAEGDNTFRMGVVDRSTERYAPLGYGKEHYVRPTKTFLKNNPESGTFSVLIDSKTGDTLFSPMGLGEDAIMGPMRQGLGTAKTDKWENPAKNPNVVSATGTLDKDGNVQIHIRPDDPGLAPGTDVPKLIQQTQEKAGETYITSKDLRATAKANEAGSLIIAQGSSKAGEPAMWYIRKPNGQRIASNFPDKESAIAHAQSLVTGGIGAPELEYAWRPWTDETGATRTQRVTTQMTPKTPRQVGAEAFFQRSQGSLIDAFDSARGVSHAKEYENIIDEVVRNVLDNPELRLNRPGVKQALQEAIGQIAQDITNTYGKDVGMFRQRIEQQPEFFSPSTSAALRAAGISVREISDMVRAGAVFLRPAYIPNNWAGNAFLNTIQQGVFAPVNLAKAMFIDKNLGARYGAGIDQAMGFNAASVMTGGRGAGYVASAVDPVAKLMGSIADQPFRRAAWIHAARRAGYRTMGDIRRLWDVANKEKVAFANRKGIEGGAEWSMEDTPALAQIGKISREAQEEIIKFDKYNDVESSILRNLIFVYSWMRGAGRYFGRFPFQHPIQAAAMTSLAGVGQNWLNQAMGGVPSFLVGAIPVGKDEKGNTMLINPFSVNPLGTGSELLATAGSLKDIVTNPRNFNKYVNQDPSNLLNPLVRDLLEAYGGGRPMSQTVPESIAALRLKENLEHPGRGQIYPTTRQEALGQFFVGSMYPRMTSQEGITRSLERQRQYDPIARIPTEVEVFKKTTGQDIPPQFVDAYKQDLQKLQKQKDFQLKYAQDHGSQGFTNLPAQNRAEAAMEYLSKNHLIAPQDLMMIQEQLQNPQSEAQVNDLANLLWRMTGAGNIKTQWDQMIHLAKGMNKPQALRP